MFGENSYRELGIGLVPYSPLGRGFFGGKAITESVPSYSFLVWTWFL
jgi:aryl-alcohol dehydrogenase-like predicted oxidoreductase